MCLHKGGYVNHQWDYVNPTRLCTSSSEIMSIEEEVMYISERDYVSQQGGYVSHKEVMSIAKEIMCLTRRLCPFDERGYVPWRDYVTLVDISVKLVLPTFWVSTFQVPTFQFPTFWGVSGDYVFLWRGYSSTFPILGCEKWELLMSIIEKLEYPRLFQ